MSRYIIDIETNGLLDNMLDYSSFPYKLKSDAKLWCVVLNDIDTGKVTSASNEQITKEWLRDSLKDCTLLSGHNIIKFDLLVLQLFGVLDYYIGYLNQPDTLFGKKVKMVDTLIVSRLFNPDRFGGHSLESWGDRLGVEKINYRQVAIDKGYVDSHSERGAEFSVYSQEMLTYCIGDVTTNAELFKELVKEVGNYKGLAQACKLENKLADLAVRRESLGFFFDKKLAVECVEDLTKKMQDLADKVNPILPEKQMNKGELFQYTPPKIQIIKDNKISANIVKFADKIGATVTQEDDKFFLNYESKKFQLPYREPLKTHSKATIDDLDHVKNHLIKLGWEPSEWRIRNLTKDSKKQDLPYEKRITSLNRWYEETIGGKYKKSRLKVLGIPANKIIDRLSQQLKQDYPVNVPTSPSVRVGVDKELCPSLTALGDKVSFANDFALYLTYKHRKASIAGGDIEDMDFNTDAPNTGYLSMYREEDGRVSTPAIEIGAASNRYRHIGIANIPRATSIYGKEMRSLFGCGENAFQFGYDFSSLEARVNGHYVMPYKGGQELAELMVAEKPNDLHTLMGKKLSISRTDAKSVNYAVMYGAQPKKLAKMLKVDTERGEEIYNNFWDAVPPLKELKKEMEKQWTESGEKYIIGIDGRKINIRSKHSILNFLFQSAGVICAKYVHVFSMQELEEKGYCVDPFIAKPDICSMCEYHDEVQLYINKDLVKFKTFDTEDDAKSFIKNWNGEQLSAVSKGKAWYVTLPNDVSLAIDKAINKTEELLKLNVNLGFEYSVSNNWYGCH